MKKGEENVTSALAGQPEIYEHIGALTKDVLRKNNVEASDSIATDFCKEICKQFGGQQVYLPLGGDAMKKDEENVTSALAGQPEIYEHIGALTKDVLRKNNVEASDSIAIDICKELCKQFGGAQAYFPLGRDFERLERDRKIYLEFSGNNIPALASKYGLSAVQIRNILQKRRSCVKQTKQTHGE